MNLYDRVEEVINEWDPIELLPLFPKQEYRDEILEILELLNKTHDIDGIANGINNIFINAFGDDVFKKDKNECIKIAKQIVSLL